MKKADYSRIASVYDKGRPITERTVELWLGFIARFSNIQEDTRALDLGCGTGRFTIPMATKLHIDVTGADISEEMLNKAREKDTTKLVKWDREDAQRLTYSDSSFEIVFMSHLLHHVDLPHRVLSECYRVLTTSGTILIRYGAIEQIRDDVEHTFFPDTLKIDKTRTPSVKTVEKWLKEAGFSCIVSEEIVYKTFESSMAHLDMAKLKGISVLTMIPPETFETGIHKLTRYIKDKPNDPRLLQDRLTLTAGYKRHVN